MNPKDKKPDTALDRDLDEVRQAYRGQDTVEPPALVDQRILNVARRAVEGKTEKAKWENWRWVSVVSMAAVAVLTLTLVMDQTIRSPQPPEEPFQRVNPEKNRIPADKLDAATAVGREQGDYSSDESKTEASGQLILEDRQESEYFRDEEGEQAQSQLRTRDTRLDLPENVVETGRTELENEVEESALPASREMSRQVEADTQTGEDSEPGWAENKPAATPEYEKIAGGREPPAPEVWLQTILRLQQEEQTEAFERELEEFIRVYPDYPLPEALQLQ